MDKRRIKKELADREAVRRCAREFGVIGDETRMKICYLLRCYPELSVGEMAKAVDLSVSAVSHALKKLRAAKLVRGRRSHKQVFYCLCPTPLTRYLEGRLKAPVRR